MIAFPNAKINLGLHVTEKRADGFHAIETVFYPIPWHDALEITPATTAALQVEGLTIEGDTANNLVWKAYQVLRDACHLGPVQFHLLKAIPFGAGLGGGSADGAVALQLLNQHFEIGLSASQLKAYAALLGSDCPFFIDNTPALGTGRGEILTPVEVKLSGYHLVVIYPTITVNTGWAYRQLTPAPVPMPLSTVIQMPVEDWDLYLTNDFEGPVFSAYPTLELLKLGLYDAGAIYAAMSGSGSAIFGLFEQPQTLTDIASHFRMPVDNILTASL